MTKLVLVSLSPKKSQYRICVPVPTDATLPSVFVPHDREPATVQLIVVVVYRVVESKPNNSWFIDGFVKLLFKIYILIFSSDTWKYKKSICYTLKDSTLDPVPFLPDPDPDPQIRLRKNGFRSPEKKRIQILFKYAFLKKKCTAFSPLI